MEEITFQVQRDEGSGRGITTQGKDLRDLQQHIDAVAVHFDEGDAIKVSFRQAGLSLEDFLNAL
jgi:hypothetical protein